MFPIYSLNIVLPLISDALLGNAVQSLCKTVLVCLYPDSPKACCSLIQGVGGRSRERKLSRGCPLSITLQSQHSQTHLTLGAETRWGLSGSILLLNI